MSLDGLAPAQLDGTWEKWDPNRPGDLARFATPNLPAKLRPRDLYERRELVGRRQGNAETGEALYELLRSCAIPYSLHAWEPTRGQRIRDAAWMLDESATCLDLALLYAGMCVNQRLRPYVALLGAADGYSVGHAITLIDPREGPQLEGQGAFDDPVWSDGSLPDDMRERLIAVDVAQATRSRNLGFADACAVADRQLRSSAFNDVTIVDVVALQRSGDPAYVPLRQPGQRPAIRPNLPEVIDFETFDSRQEVHEKLLRARGTVVLCGESGTGKSSLALQVAREIDQESGWFLAATDPSTLQTSLAHAEARESAPETGVPELADIAALAGAARQRLAEADGPWVVVVDNADSDPGRIERWLPRPNPDLSQLVLITTTNREWLERGRGYLDEQLEPIDGNEVKRLVGGSDGLVALIGGRPLLAQAFHKLATAAPGTVEGLDTGADALMRELKRHAGPTVYWRAVCEAAPEVRDGAERLAWLAPDTIDRDLAAAVTGSTETVAKLIELGVLAPRVGARSFAMHRLVGTAIRAAMAAERRAALALALARDGQVLDQIDQYGDQETLETLVGELLPAADGAPDVDVGAALARAAGAMELLGFGQRAVDVYRAAIGHLRNAMTDEHRELLAEALSGSARGVKDYETADDPGLAARLVEAIGWADEARAIRATITDEPPGHRDVLVARSDAMLGLLRKEQRRFPADGETERSILEEALATLTSSYEMRRDRLAPDGAPQAEVARALYNLAGIRIDLAKLLARDEAAKALQDADQIYKDVLAQRTQLYPRGQHPHIAACHNGLGIVDYYRAVLLGPDEDGSLEQRNAWDVKRNGWLRTAAAHVLRGLADRQDLDGDLDLEEAAASFDLLTKITMARQAWARRNIERAGRRKEGPTLTAVFPVVDDFRREMAAAGVFEPADAQPGTWATRVNVWSVAPKA